MEKQVYVTKADLALIKHLLDGLAPDPSGASDPRRLGEKVQAAVVVSPSAVPPFVVTLNSRVVLQDLDTGRTGEYTLVLPSKSDISATTVSVLAPAGVSLLGQMEEDVVEWAAPVGRKRFRIERVAYQPEADARNSWPEAQRGSTSVRMV